MEGKSEGSCLSEQMSHVRLAAHSDWMLRSGGGGGSTSRDESRANFILHSAVSDQGTCSNDIANKRMDSEGDGGSAQDYICSQDFFCTPDFITPTEQQFSVDFEGNKENVLVPRSPMSLTMVRSKRRRPDVGALLSSALTESRKEALQLSSELPSCGDLVEGLSSVASEYEGSGLDGVDTKARVRLSALQQRRVQNFLCVQNPFLPREPDVDSARERRSKWEGYQTSGMGGSLSRYRDEFHEIKEIGRGYFSRVYKARNRIDGCLYAIKRTHHQLRQDSERNQALVEVQALAAIGSHPHVVRYHSAWFEDDYLFIQMELCFWNLTEMKAAGELSSEKSLIEVLWQITQALALMYVRGLVHLDIKPDNIYVQHGVFKLGDFGRASRIDGTMLIEEGDSRYTPLEILNDDYSQLHKVDIFALGATIYELARGLPLPSSGVQFQALRQGKLATLPEFSQPFQLLLKEMMHPVPSCRPMASDMLNHSIFQNCKRICVFPGLSHDLRSDG